MGQASNICVTLKYVKELFIPVSSQRNSTIIAFSGTWFSCALYNDAGISELDHESPSNSLPLKNIYTILSQRTQETFSAHIK